MRRTLKVEGINCNHCVEVVKKAMYSINCISHVELCLEEGRVHVHMEKDIPFHILKSALEEWGYRVVGEV